MVVGGWWWWVVREYVTLFGRAGGEEVSGGNGGENGGMRISALRNTASALHMPTTHNRTHRSVMTVGCYYSELARRVEQEGRCRKGREMGEGGEGRVK